MTSFSSFYFTLDGFCFWGGVRYFPEFPKLLVSCYGGFVKVRLGGVGKGVWQNYGGGIMLSVGGVGLKFRKILFQLFAMHIYPSLKF